MVKYIEIADDIRRKINNNEYSRGQKLPYEYVLCANYRCNKTTMKKALEILVKEGLIVRRRGAGTFVKEQDTLTQSAAQSSSHGLTHTYPAAKVTSKIIEFEVIAADEMLAHHLHIEEGSFVYHIIRHRLIDGKSHSLEYTYIPISIIPNLKRSNLEGSIYDYIENDLNLKIHGVHKIMHTVESGSLDRGILGIKKGHPAIEIEQVGYLSSGVIFEYSLSRYDYKDFKTSFVTVL